MKKKIFIILILFSICFEIAQSQNLQWVKQIGNASGNFFILSSVTDASGNLYTTGVFDGTIDFDPEAATTIFTDVGFGDIYVSKIDSVGNFKWAKQIGRESYDQGTSIALDASGNIYVCGFFSMDSTDFDPGNGIHFLSNPNSGPLTYILKLDPSGNFIWVKDFGPASNSPSSITLDASGNILICGIFGGTVDFDPGAGVYNLTSATNDIYILKLNATGNFLWAKQIDLNTTQTRSSSLATDAAENIYITGRLLGTVDFDPGPGISTLTATTIFGAEYILKLNAAGNFAWAKVINGNISPSGADRSIRVDDAGNSYTIGWFGGTVDFNPGSGVFNLVNTASAGASTYLLKLDSTGNFVWAKQIGDPGDGNFRAIALDASQNLYITGMINSSGNFDPGSGTDTLSIHNGSSFVAKYDGNGNLIWAVNFSNDTTGSDADVTLNLDAFGNIISTGTFHGIGDFDPGSGIFNLTSNSAEDVFIHKLHQYSTTSVNNLMHTQNSLSVYPNPSNGSFFIETKNGGNYIIVDEMGQILRSFTVNVRTSYKISITGLPDGIYFVLGYNKSKFETRKIIVQK
ncbi:MAG: SBBP repeat-containing protein [Bacteroidetes bacterium]|nr:SBBP repeat-containing protein [Bacteroidota bacterium]